MKFCTLIISLLFFGLCTHAQDFKAVSNKSSVKQTIQKQHSATKSLSADFTEEIHSTLFTKPMKGNGSLLYKQTDKIRWENATSKHIILLNGSAVKMSENGKKITDPMTNKMVKKIQGMMLSMLSGDFLNEKEFSISYYENSGLYKLILTPKSQRMAKYIQKIELLFSKQSLLLTQMKMFESKDQQLVYLFSNTKINTTINDSKFTQF